MFVVICFFLVGGEDGSSGFSPLRGSNKVGKVRFFVMTSSLTISFVLYQ